MKIKKTSIIAMALALALSIGLIPVNAYAAQAQDQPKAEQVAASINYDITVTFNGEAKALSNVNGQQVYPVLYGGTTYVPIRAIGYLLGLNVDWDQATRTVLLDKPANGQTADIKTAKPDDPKKTGTQAIRPTIDPGITVKYNGEAQTMKTATGAVVYPMIDGGTTYLPIRAVGNMLGLDVDWEQTTQTVKLTGKAAGQDITVDTPKGKIVINTGDTSTNIRKTLEDAGVSKDMVENILTVIIGKKPTSDPDTNTVTNDRVANDWLTLDWSTAKDGYIRVKVSDKLGDIIMGNFNGAWIDENGKKHTFNYGGLIPGVEYDIPLEGGSTEYAVALYAGFQVCEHLRPEEARGLVIPGVTARFTVEMDNPDSCWLVSTPRINFKNSQNTCIKALEITKNCTTEAEKITAVFNWVSSNIKYDHAMAARMEASKQNPSNRPSQTHETDCFDDPDSDNHWDYRTSSLSMYDELDPDRILAAKSGVCQHYAALMTAMLRSLGIECKYVEGLMKPSNGDWTAHAWVAVNPKTGTLNKSALGAGKDYEPAKIGEGPNEHPTGWIRLDPTNAHVPNFTSNDANYHPTGWK